MCVQSLSHCWHMLNNMLSTKDTAQRGVCHRFWNFLICLDLSWYPGLFPPQWEANHTFSAYQCSVLEHMWYYVEMQ